MWHDTIHLVYLYAMPASDILHLHYFRVVYHASKDCELIQSYNRNYGNSITQAIWKVVERSLRCNSRVLIARNTFYHEQARLRQDKSSPVLWLATWAAKTYPALGITRCPFTRYEKFSPQTKQTFHKRALKRSKNSRHLPKQKREGYEIILVQCKFAFASLNVPWNRWVDFQFIKFKCYLTCLHI